MEIKTLKEKERTVEHKRQIQKAGRKNGEAGRRIIEQQRGITYTHTHRGTPAYVEASLFVSDG